MIQSTARNRVCEVVKSLLQLHQLDWVLLSICETEECDTIEAELLCLTHCYVGGTLRRTWVKEPTIPTLSIPHLV